MIAYSVASHGKSPHQNAGQTGSCSRAHASTCSFAATNGPFELCTCRRTGWTGGTGASRPWASPSTAAPRPGRTQGLPRAVLASACHLKQLPATTLRSMLAAITLIALLAAAAYQYTLTRQDDSAHLSTSAACPGDRPETRRRWAGRRKPLRRCSQPVGSRRNLNNTWSLTADIKIRRHGM